MKLDENTTLTVLDAIKIAANFLEARRQRTGGDTPLDLVVGDMEVISEKGEEIETSDPAIWGDWLEAAEEVFKEKETTG